MTFPTRSTLPDFRVFTDPEPGMPSSRMPVAPPYDSSTMGVGNAMRMASPALAALRGMGDMQVPGGSVGPVLGLLLLAGVGALSYQAGKAMAPRGSKPSTWGWIGVASGMLTGPIGLGVMGIVSNSKDG